MRSGKETVHENRSKPSGVTNPAVVAGDVGSGGGEGKLSSLTNAILDHFKRTLSSASLKSNKSSSTSLNKLDNADDTNKTPANAINAQSAEPEVQMRTRRTGFVHGGVVNVGFVDDNQSEPFAILREKTSKKTTKPKWQKQLSTFHSEISVQKFSEQQKRALRSYSSANYMPAHSITYVRWMKIHRASIISRLDIDRWFLITLIGLSVGLVATLLKQCIQGVTSAQWKLTRSYIATGSLGEGFAYLAGTNVLMVFGGAILVTMFHPMSAGGGAPEVIAFLNGIKVHGTLSIKNLVTKFIANILAVGSGLPAAVQGPLITYGAIIGAGVGQFQSKPFHFSPNVFRRFRNAEDRRTFTTDGVAAGVSAGFHSPIGGLLFAMEDLSSFWSKGLSWQTFFCSVVATSTAQLFNTAFNAFKYTPPFGFFYMAVVLPIRMHVMMFLPSILLGVVGGLLGVIFTRVNVFINQKRKQLLSKIKNVKIQQLIKMIEPCIIVTLMTAYMVFLPLATKCKSIRSVELFEDPPTNYTKSPFDGIKFQSYMNCPKHDNQTQYYNEMATLIQAGGQSYLDALWSRNTFYVFDYATCLCAFAIYFPLTIWTAGSAIAGGIFVPILISGSLLGRALGAAFIIAYNKTTQQTFPSDLYAWIDPGVMAAVGAGALLSGVNRLEVASTVILVEMVGDINLVLPVLIAIFVAKTIAGKLSKPLYKYQLEGKALPFLDSEPELVINGKILNMELWRARDIMASPVHTIELTVSVHKVAKLLLETKHNGFPVVKYDDEANFEVVHGMVTRQELYSILGNEEVYKFYHENTSVETTIEPKIPYEEMDTDGRNNVEKIMEMLRSYTMKKDLNTRINLDLYVNMSVTKVDQNYSLMRTYRLFRTMGLRQLLVTDSRNKPVGMITRKDLMQFNMQEKLEKLIGMEIPDDPGFGIPKVLSGHTPVTNRRMSRRFSVEEGSVLGVMIAEGGGADSASDSKEDTVIELPAITRVKKIKMETIREEEGSNTDAEHSPVDGDENPRSNSPESVGESFTESERVRKSSSTVVDMEQHAADDANNNNDDRAKTDACDSFLASQLPHLRRLYLQAIGQSSTDDHDNSVTDEDESQPASRTASDAGAGGGGGDAQRF